MKMVKREAEIAFLQRHRNKQIIKVVTGVRRCGKSTLLELFREQLISEGVDKSQIHAVNFEDMAFEHLQEYHALYEYIVARLVPDKWNYVFLDEIQHVPAFEKVVDSLYIQPQIDIYLTGSNAYLLSGELATLLSGRYVELSMLPLSYREFCTAHEGERLSKRELYEKYVTESSFPYTLQINGNEQGLTEYLRGIYNTVLLKDVVARWRISDVYMLESVTKYVFANIGSLLSSRKIANAMTSSGRKIDGKTVERYLKGLTDSFVLYPAERFDMQSKELLRFNPKYYVVDAALRFLVVGRKGYDTGHILENVVYLELVRRGYRVYVGAMDGGEVDFVVKDNDGLTYYQVAESTQNPEVLEREIRPLRNIHDHYPKYLLTMDEVNAAADYDGIQKLNVLSWLLGKNR